MQIMDLFPQVTIQLDSLMTSYANQSAKKGRQDTQFSDVLSSVREADSKPRSGAVQRGKKADTPPETEKTEGAPEETEKLEDTGEPMEDDDITDDAAAVSMLAQANVVLILEGNKDVDTAPDTADDVSVKLGAPVEGAVVTEDGEMPVPQAMKPEDSGDEEVAEQMARMPEATEKPRETKDKTNDGDLCPLENENENETSETKGKKDKSSHVGHTAEDKQVKDGGATTERVIPTNQTVDVRPERFSAAEQLRGVTVQQPVTQSNLFEAMVEKIETMQVDGMNKMSIQLKPEYLGKVSLQLSMTASGLQVRINADDLNVKNAIGGQINALIETLSSKGVEVAKVEVLHTGVGSYSFTNGQGGSSQPQQSAPAPRYAKGGDGDTAGFDFPAADEAPDILDDELSSVEYHA